MHKFTQFGIKPTNEDLVGDITTINRILNREITVTDYRIEDLTYGSANGKLLSLQFKIGEHYQIILSDSKILIDTIQLVPKTGYPFTTTIVLDGQRLKFS